MKLEEIILSKLDTEKTIIDLVKDVKVTNWYDIGVINSVLNQLIDKKLIVKFDKNRILNTYKKI